jgi:hypothetical protein
MVNERRERSENREGEKKHESNKCQQIFDMTNETVRIAWC